MKEKLFELIKKAFKPEEIKALKDAHVKLSDLPVTLKEVTTKDGKKMSYDGELAEGVVINEVTAEGPKPCADGDYTLEDGTVVSVAGGKVSKVVKAAPATPATETEMAAKLSAQKKEIEDSFEIKLKKQDEAHKAEIAEVKKISLQAFEALNKILDIPVDTETKTSLSTDWHKKPYAEMTNYEKAKYNRGEY